MKNISICCFHSFLFFLSSLKSYFPSFLHPFHIIFSPSFCSSLSHLSLYWCPSYCLTFFLLSASSLPFFLVSLCFFLSLVSPFFVSFLPSVLSLSHDPSSLCLCVPFSFLCGVSWFQFKALQTWNFTNLNGILYENCVGTLIIVVIPQMTELL